MKTALQLALEVVPISAPAPMKKPVTPQVPALTVSDRMAARILAKGWHYGAGSAEVLGEWAR